VARRRRGLDGDGGKRFQRTTSADLKKWFTDRGWMGERSMWRAKTKEEEIIKE
jgi:hypothetical protein